MEINTVTCPLAAWKHQLKKKDKTQTISAIYGLCMAAMLLIQIRVRCKSKKWAAMYPARKKHGQYCMGGKSSVLCPLQACAFMRSSGCYNTRRSVSSGSKTKVLWRFGVLSWLYRSLGCLWNRTAEPESRGPQDPPSLPSHWTAGALVLVQFK